MKLEDQRAKTYDTVSGLRDRGTGPDSAGQSGDTQGLSNLEEAGDESVAELVEEGNSFEAEVISGIENAPDADVSEVHVHHRRGER